MGKNSKEITVTKKWIEFDGSEYGSKDIYSVNRMYSLEPMAPEPKLLFTGDDEKRYEVEYSSIEIFNKISVGKKYIIQQKGIINKKVVAATRVTS